MRKPGLMVGISLVSLALAGCGSSDQVTADPSASAYGTIRISTGISEETDIVANIYAGALEEIGYSVELVDTGDDRAGYLTAMEGDSTQVSAETATSTFTNDPQTVDITPDYSGNLLLYLTNDGAFSPSYIEQQREAMASSSPSSTYTYGWGSNSEAAGEEAAQEASMASSATEDSSATASSSAESASSSPSSTGLNASALSSSGITDAISRVLPESLSLLNASDAQNRDSLVITKATAAKYSISTIDDLAEYCGELVFGGPSSFKDRSYGLRGLEQRYGCVPESFTEENSQETLSDQLAQNQVQVADIFSASAEIDENAYVVIEGTDSLFIPQQIVPVIRTSELPGSAQDAINSVSAKLSSEDLETFNQLTSGDNPLSQKDVATFWLEQTRE